MGPRVFNVERIDSTLFNLPAWHTKQTMNDARKLPVIYSVQQQPKHHKIHEKRSSKEKVRLCLCRLTIKASRATVERENALTSLRICHTMDAHAGRDVNIVHVLRRDEQILLAVRRISRVDLQEPSERDESEHDDNLPSSSC